MERVERSDAAFGTARAREPRQGRYFNSNLATPRLALYSRVHVCAYLKTRLSSALRYEILAHAGLQSSPSIFRHRGLFGKLFWNGVSRKSYIVFFFISKS